MKQRGRKSAASLIGVMMPVPMQRPEPPDGESLDDEATREWWAVVNRLPADHFPRETHALLAAFCRHVVAARDLAGTLRALDDALHCAIEDGRDRLSVLLEATKCRDRLLRMRDRETRAASSLATRLRITLQAARSPALRPPAVSPHPKPWDPV